VAKSMRKTGNYFCKILEVSFGFPQVKKGKKVKLSHDIRKN
jgi:hypothetical protein